MLKRRNKKLSGATELTVAPLKLSNVQKDVLFLFSLDCGGILKKLEGLA